MKKWITPLLVFIFLFPFVSCESKTSEGLLYKLEPLEPGINLIKEKTDFSLEPEGYFIDEIKASLVIIPVSIKNITTKYGPLSVKVVSKLADGEAGRYDSNLNEIMLAYDILLQISYEPVGIAKSEKEVNRRILDNIRIIFLHEFGHALDRNLGRARGVVGMFSWGGEWGELLSEIVKENHDSVGIKIIQSEYSLYGQIPLRFLQETFADFFMLYMRAEFEGNEVYVKILSPKVRNWFKQNIFE